MGNGPQRHSPAHRWPVLHRARTRVARMPGGELSWRVGIGVLGTAIVMLGVALLPLPGPGWLVIFLGLGVWATEFDWAARLLTYARHTVGSWTAWVQTKPRWLQLLIGGLSLVILITLIVGCYLVYRRFVS